MVSHELHAMMESDETHWWYRGRRHVLHAAIAGLELPADARILDAGCGSGRTLDELVRYGHATGLDLSSEAVEVAHSRGHSDVWQGAVERTPFPSAGFDLVTCLDVVEHTRDDRLTLAELRRIARPGAALVVTVPAYQALWSAHDEANLHYRRYRSATLRRAATAAGWQLVRDSYFNSLLLAPAAVVRLAKRGRPPRAGHSDLAVTPRWLDSVLELPLDAEARAIAAGVRLPAGLSLLGIFRNPVGVDVAQPVAPERVALAAAA